MDPAVVLAWEGSGCVVAPVSPPALTPRQARIFLLLAEGKSSKEIAHVLGITYSAVRDHVERGRDRLGAISIAAAVWTARRQLDGAAA